MKKNIGGYPYLNYESTVFDQKELIENSAKNLELMIKRRSVREYSDRDVPFEVIENIIKTAALAPSGANKQPWMFCVVKDPKIKQQIRKAAEEEELESYNNRMSEEWLEDLKHLGTDWQKPFLETAPYLIIMFKQVYDLDESGIKKTNYYVQESVGIAAGFLISAIHKAGLATLTHTPSPMNFLQKILDRPVNEKPYLLLPVGYPADECWVPDIKKKSFDEICKIY
jgi:iodotyrosine deiodinase